MDNLNEVTQRLIDILQDSTEETGRRELAAELLGTLYGTAKSLDDATIDWNNVVINSIKWLQTKAICEEKLNQTPTYGDTEYDVAYLNGAKNLAQEILSP